MDTSPQDVFILDKQPGQEKPDRQGENSDDRDDAEEADSREENSENDDNDSVSALKGVRTKKSRVNGLRNRGHISSDESSGEDDDDVDISKVAPSKAVVATSCILTKAS